MSDYFSQPLSSGLIEAYQSTDYCFKADKREIVIRLNNDNQEFAAFLLEKKIETWAFITAWNPYSVIMPDAYNTAQQNTLIGKLKDNQIWKGEGRSREVGSWTPEESFFIADISEALAIELGQEFGQNAILVGKSDGIAILKILFSAYTYSFSDGKLMVVGDRALYNSVHQCV